MEPFHVQSQSSFIFTNTHFGKNACHPMCTEKGETLRDEDVQKRLYVASQENDLCVMRFVV
jgi:hypothetical protein